MPNVKIVGLPSKGLNRFDIGGVTNTTTISPMLFPGIKNTTPSPFTFNWMGTDTTTTIVPPYSPDYTGPIDPAARAAMVTRTTTFNVPSKECPEGYYEDKDGKCVPARKPIEALNDIVQYSLASGNVLAQVAENRRTKESGERNIRNKLFTGMVQNPSREFLMGNQTVNGYQFPGSMAPPNEGQYQNAFYGKQASFGGSFMADEQAPSKLRIKIIDAPDDDMATMKYGGQAGYSLDMNWRKSFTKMNKTSSDYYTNGMSEDKTTDEEPVLEAEGGETIFKPGDQTMFNLNGPRHSEGGVALTKDQVESKNKPDLASFIFSDTNKMKIKDKDTLEYFGVAYKKGGVTPAKVSKKYDLNQWQAILNDPTSDPISKATAQLMLNKNIPRLAELAVVQEKMKGLKPPAFAEQILGGGGQQGQEQQAGPGAQMATGKFGGSYATGGVTNTTTTPPSAPVKKSGVGLGEWTDDYEKLESTLMDDRNKELRKELFNRYKKQYPKSPVTEEQYIQNLLNAQKQNFAIRAAYGDDKYLQDEDWDKGGKERNKRYNKEVKALGLTPLTDNEIVRFQSGYRDLEQAMREPKFFETFGKYFRTKQFGKPDEPDYLGKKTISKPDKIYGNTTAGEVFELSGWTDATTTQPPVFITTTRPPDVVAPKYICIPDGKGGGNVVETSGSGYGYSTPEEAGKHCGERAKRPPYDFLLPDKVNMLAKAAFAPEMILPFNPDLAFSPRSLNLEYWDAPAAAAFATQYAAPAAQLATYGPTQGLTSNLAFLAGQAAQNITGQIMPGVIARNVDRTNAFSGEEAKRQDTVDAYNNMQKQKRYEGYATAKQNTTNAWRQYLKENSDAFTRAWDNRQNLGDINDTNTQFYKDPTSGRQTFYNPNYAGRAGSGGGGDDVASLGSKFNSYYNTFYNQLNDPNLSPEQRKEQAAKWATAAIESSRTSITSDPYKNQYRVKTTGYNGS
jgi:hypothetical protein